MTIGEKIRQQRKNAGLTQKKLGELSGTSETTIKQYELGKRQPRIEQLQKIADALQISYIALLDADSTVPGTLAAHFDGEEYTAEELEEIKKFAAYVKAKRTNIGK